MKLKPLTEQVVVVAGASTGIGRLTALEVAQRGAKVVVTARDPEGLETLVEEIRQAGGRAVAVPADVSVPGDLEAVAEAAERTFGGLDTWINMAAVTVYAAFEETSPEEWNRVISVNLLGYAHGMRAALPRLRRRGGGAIINVSSVEGKVALPLQSAYAASKHAVVGMTDALRIELKHDRMPISISNIMPASIDTPLFDHARTKMGVKPRGIPPVYPPEDVVGAIVYACEHRVRELVVGGAGRALIGMKRVAPSLVEAILARVGYGLQRTDEPRGPESGDTLYSPQPDDRIKGEITARSRPVRLPGWGTRHPAATALAALALVAASVWAAKAMAAR